MAKNQDFDEINVQRINVREPDGRLRYVLANGARLPSAIMSRTGWIPTHSFHRAIARGPTTPAPLRRLSRCTAPGPGDRSCCDDARVRSIFLTGQVAPGEVSRVKVGRRL